LVLSRVSGNVDFSPSILLYFMRFMGSLLVLKNILIITLYLKTPSKWYQISERWNYYIILRWNNVKEFGRIL
jgi:hypothetical protein